MHGIGSGSGSRAILLRNNRARAGGAVYVECSNIGTCAEAFDADNKIGALPQLPKVEFTGSQASSYGYGDTLATLPASMRWQGGASLDVEIVPSRASAGRHDLEYLVVAVQSLDAMGSVARGLEGVIIEVRVCRSRGACTIDSALLPVVYEPFDRETGVSSFSFQLECPLGSNEAALEVGLVRFTHVPVLRTLIQCGKCPSGESKTEDSTSGTWFCVACADNQYVMDPNNAAHSCQDCPAGGSCNGSNFTPLLGSEWARDEAAGVYRIARCAAGSSIKREPYLDQSCVPCKAGYYCPGGNEIALKCPANTFSEPNATNKNTCVEADFVDLTVNLPLSQSEFDQEQQMLYKNAIASSAGVDASYVDIISYAETSTRRHRARMLLASSLAVETRIASTGGGTEALIKNLDPDTINSNLQANGLPAGTVTKQPSVRQDSTKTSGLPTFAVILIVMGGLLVILVIIGLVLWTLAPKKRGKTPEMKQREAQRRVEVRREEFDTRLAQHEERMRRTEARRNRNDARLAQQEKTSQAGAAASPQAVVSASLHVSSQPEIEHPLPSAASLHTVTSSDQMLQHVVSSLDIEISSFDKPVQFAADGVENLNDFDGLASPQTLGSQQQHAFGLKWKKIGAKPRTGIEMRNPELAEALQQGKLIFTQEELTLFEVEYLDADSYILVGEDTYFAPSQEPDILEESKFKATQLILGKSADSVLNTFIGLEETSLSQALVSPLDAIEQEWFPYGFVLLTKEPRVGDKGYGDLTYQTEITEARNKFDAEVIDAEEWCDEKERIEDEYEDRKYKWWLAGANFDYLRYGHVGNVRNPAENFWLPPQVRHKELNGYPGGFTQPGDYDSGFYDTPALQLELGIALGATGEVNDKGLDNAERLAFKKTVAADLAHAACVPISEEGLPVISVTPAGPTDENRVFVVMHILQDLDHQRGPDECWQLASSFCEESNDLSSALLRGHKTRHLVRGGVKMLKKRDREGMTLADFTNHETSQVAGLCLWHVFALRAYTSDSYPLFNNPMRERIKPHPLKYTMYFLDQALKMLTTVEAKLRPAEYNKIKYLWRGMRNIKVDDENFFAEGGSELAAMSATNNLNVAIEFSHSEVPLIFRFEARGRSRGVEIDFLSVFPKEKEFLYSPLTGLVLLNLERLAESELVAMHRAQVQDKSGQTREDVIKKEMERLQDELEKMAEDKPHCDKADAAGEKIYYVYEVRPMRFVASLFLVCVCVCVSVCGRPYT